VAYLEELLEALTSVVKLYDTLESAKEAIHDIQGLAEPSWHEQSSKERLLNTCQALILTRELKNTMDEYKGHLSRVESFASQEGAHPVTNKILVAFKKRDLNAYSVSLGELNSLRALSEKNKGLNKALKNCRDYLPEFTKKLCDSFRQDKWNSRVNLFEQAVAWSKAKSWIDNFLCKEDLSSVEHQAKRLDEDIKDYMAELASLKAWQFCFSRLEDHHRRHLIGWHQAMKKVGKGTGRHAPKHRRDAQKHLNECKDSIPAWVMPLHRVYETVKASPGSFDVIIVDEASQCGFESLPLMYLAKQLLVVGDDKQISPEPAGVNQDRVQQLKEEYLYDFEHDDLFDLHSSLFDHANRRFGTSKIVLREHFRCMPEIITFSNDLCYQDTPLIPLRQYPPDRLKPLIARHVPKGYREGKGSKAINRPEAKAVVDVIEECCNDDKYENKTFGVITLQGNAQAGIIEGLLLDRLGAEEMERRKLICGNPYSFQGDERDVIFLSMVAAANTRISSLARQEDVRRFNVAASRARDQMWLFHTASLGDLSSICLRHQLLTYFLNPRSRISKALNEDAEELRQRAAFVNRRIEKPPRPFDSWFEVDVALLIADRGYRVIPQYEIAGKRIDLVIEGARSRLAVEVDGDKWHGLEQHEKDVERQRMLERCGWVFHRIRGSAFYGNKDAVMNALWNTLKRQGIESITGDFQLSNHTNTDAIQNHHPEEKNNQQQQPFAAESAKHVEMSQLQLMPSVQIVEVIVPTDIQTAMAMKPAMLREAIIETLTKRPNFSCKKDDLHGIMLKEWNVRTKGRPREDFARKVNNAVRYLDRQGVVEIYKSKNVRVRLLKDNK